METTIFKAKKKKKKSVNRTVLIVFITALMSSYQTFQSLNNQINTSCWKHEAVLLASIWFLSSLLLQPTVATIQRAVILLHSHTLSHTLLIVPVP